jgi:hypothetical protein
LIAGRLTYNNLTDQKTQLLVASRSTTAGIELYSIVSGIQIPDSITVHDTINVENPSTGLILTYSGWSAVGGLLQLFAIAAASLAILRVGMQAGQRLTAAVIGLAHAALSDVVVQTALLVYEIFCI